MRGAGEVYVFVRAPAVGAVKRRLAAGIGDQAALRFYRATSNAAIARIAMDARWRTWICVTPDTFAFKGRFWPAHARQGVGRAPQGRGDLGRRMARALARIPARPAIVVGSDIPDLSARHVAQAFHALRSHDAVFGPSADGGYWLVGTRDAKRLPNLFRKIRWSSPHALADTLANLGTRRRVAFLETLEDVDSAADYQRWRARAG